MYENFNLPDINWAEHDSNELNAYVNERRVVCDSIDRRVYSETILFRVFTNE